MKRKPRRSGPQGCFVSRHQGKEGFTKRRWKRKRFRTFLQYNKQRRKENKSEVFLLQSEKKRKRLSFFLYIPKQRTGKRFNSSSNQTKGNRKRRNQLSCSVTSKEGQGTNQFFLQHSVKKKEKKKTKLLLYTMEKGTGKDSVPPAG